MILSLDGQILDSAQIISIFFLWNLSAPTNQNPQTDSDSPQWQIWANVV